MTSLVLGRARLIVAGCLLAGALLLRVDGITQPSLATRELHNALLARQYYLGEAAGLPAWKRDVLRELPDSVKPIEPPVLDFLAATTFRLTHGERLWIPRFISGLAWVVGGIFLVLIAARVTTRDGALVALALYLFWPYGVLISHFYMPDATMVALLLGGALAVIRYWESPSPSRLVVAGVLASLATAAKPGIALIFLISLFVAIAASRGVLTDTALRGRLVFFVALGSATSLAYYLYGTYLNDFLAGASEGRVEPRLLTTAWFWKGWREMISIVLPFPQRQGFLLALVPLAAALAGVAVTRQRMARSILVGLGLGYIAYALIFAAHTASHAYYVLPLLPILSLAIGALAGAVLGRVSARSATARSASLVLIALVLGVAIYKSHISLSTPYDGQAIADYKRIGEVTGHTTRAIIVDERLRSPAMYWGWIVGNYWYPPTPAQDLPATGNPLPSWIDREDSAFLIVVQMSELDTEERLRDFVQSLPVVARTSRYAVFDLRR